jgi:phospholipase A-2-activating protein
VPSSHPSGAAIASAANDGVIRLWTRDGREVGALEGHESFVYFIASIPQTGEIVSVGEDRTLRVWRGTECVQTVTHPAISVWSVAVCGSNGDVVTGASDGVARVWSRDAARQAAADVVEIFEESVRASAIPQEQVGGVDPQSLPGPDFLQSKSGTKEGQVQMIKQPDGGVTAHQWSSSECGEGFDLWQETSADVVFFSFPTGEGWIMIGNVVSSAGSSRRKVEHNGQEYDYVFDVQMDDNRMYKLPFNVSMNPYDAATKFLNDNELPISHLEATAKFIVQNTQGVTLGGPASSSQSAAPAQATTQTRNKFLPQQEYLSILQAKHEGEREAVLWWLGTMADSDVSPSDRQKDPHRQRHHDLDWPQGVCAQPLGRGRHQGASGGAHGDPAARH